MATFEDLTSFNKIKKEVMEKHEQIMSTPFAKVQLRIRAHLKEMKKEKNEKEKEVDLEILKKLCNERDRL